MPSWLPPLSVLCAVVVLVPLLYLGIRATEYPAEEFFGTVFSARTARLTLTSLTLTGAVTACCAIIGVALAVLVTRTSIPFRRTLAVFAALPLAVPSYVAAFGWQAMNGLVSPGTSFEGLAAAVVVMTSVTYPYVYLPAVAALMSVDPAQEEAARSLGRGPAQTLFSVTMRQVTPAITAGSLLCAIYVIADFGAPAILRVDTFTRAIFTSFSMGFDRLGGIALSSILLVLTALVLVIEGRIRRRSTRYAALGSGGATTPIRLELGRWGAPASGAAWVTVLGCLGVPVAAVSYWSYRGVSTPGSLEEVGSAFVGSLWVAALAAAATTVLAVPLALYLARRPSLIARGLERAAYFAHSLPGVVVGLSMVMLGISAVPALYQTIPMLIVAYCSLMLPLAMGPALASALNSPPELEEAAQSLGSSSGLAYLRVTLPMMAPGIGAGALMVMLTVIKELPATLMLRPTGFDTLATRLWTYTGNESFAAAAPFAVLLILLAAIPTGIIISKLLKEVR
ncbi:iron ABC transporter permease [Nesterenkonia sp. NBAIMH1]|uniref:ABC transporter permease n=2 Tax=Nesterenkonia TaxID=57494 RepID=UPI001FEF9B49|nr:iron ABC transporter permease [Nesterenkonia sp. NBAIMH1]